MLPAWYIVAAATLIVTNNGEHLAIIVYTRLNGVEKRRKWPSLVPQNAKTGLYQQGVNFFIMGYQ